MVVAISPWIRIIQCNHYLNSAGSCANPLSDSDRKRPIVNVNEIKINSVAKKKRNISVLNIMNHLQHILAPMVGASELAFRLLCRRYGATLAYTPMISSDRFAVDAKYRAEEFQTTPEDRPIVAHFSANNPEVFLAAAKHVENYCDAIGSCTNSF